MTPSKIRAELGNPDESDLSDVTIIDAFAEEVTFWGTAARCAEILARRYAHRADYGLMEYRESFSQRAKAWAEIAKDLRRKARMYGKSDPYAGGISVDDKKMRANDLSRTPPSFKRNMMEVDEDGIF